MSRAVFAMVGHPHHHRHHHRHHHHLFIVLICRGKQLLQIEFFEVGV